MNYLYRILLGALLLATLGCTTTYKTLAPPQLEEDPFANPPTAENFSWWNERVFYEIYVRSFQDSDGDGVGDLQGVIDRLDYLKEMGIGGIWLMPIMESPSEHGYDVTDYYKVDSEYGDNETFLRLMEEARKRDIKVILDLVLNHASAQHPLFQASKDPDSPYRDYFVWAEKPLHNLGPLGTKPWHFAGTNNYYYGMFWDQMPDWNLESSGATRELYNVTRFWLEEMGVDGYRLDALKYLVEEGNFLEHAPGTFDWLAKYYQFYKGINPEAFTIGEIWSDADTVLDYTGNKVDVGFQFDFSRTLVKSVQMSSNYEIKRAQETLNLTYPAGQYGTFITNHDQDRSLSSFNGDMGKAKVAATILLTSPGVPFILYGEEVGIMGDGPHERIRVPMQWEPGFGHGFSSAAPYERPGPEANQNNVLMMERDEDSLLNHYKKLIQLRNEHKTLQTGRQIILKTKHDFVHAYLRWDPQGTYLIMVNMGFRELKDSEYTLQLKKGIFTGKETLTWVMGQGDIQPIQVNDQGGIQDWKPLTTLPPRSSHIIKID